METLEQIKETFFQECEELLADLESGLLALQAGDGDGETINAVFRAVHSVKGGAGAFGLETLVRFAHTFETTLDHVRSGKLAADEATLKVLLRATDILADLVQAAKSNAQVEASHTKEVAEDLEALWAGEAKPAPVVAAPIAAPAPVEDEFGFTPVMAAPLLLPSRWRVSFHPSAATYAKANDATLLLRELERLGACETTLDVSHLPAFEELAPEEAYLSWTVVLTTAADEAAIRDVFDFVESDCAFSIENADAAPPFAAPAPVAQPDESPKATSIEPQARDKAAPKTAAQNPTPNAAPTIRVDLERVDRLIDLVGELVINQAMLAQRVAESEGVASSHVQLALESLEQLTREIQDSVMAIRAGEVGVSTHAASGARDCGLHRQASPARHRRRGHRSRQDRD
jgi:two-component system chemotaxis sensor kinase CheA